jgi:hypothetical protein
VGINALNVGAVGVAVGVGCVDHVGVGCVGVGHVGVGIGHVPVPVGHIGDL